MIDAFPPVPIIVGILVAFLIAGSVKGSLGIGFPAVAMPILLTIIDPALGVTLLAIPIFVTNAIQFLTVQGWPAIIRRFLVAGFFVTSTIFIVVQFVDSVPSRWINVACGLSLIIFALASLSKVELPLSESVGWQMLVGITSGLIGGVSAVKAPIMIYTVGLKLPREDFICAAGFLFFTGGVGLVAGTWSASLLNGVTAALSFACCAVALAGFRFGAWIRHRLSDRMFRLILLWVILAMGLRLVLMNLF